MVKDTGEFTPHKAQFNQYTVKGIFLFYPPEGV